MSYGKRICWNPECGKPEGSVAAAGQAAGKDSGESAVKKAAVEKAEVGSARKCTNVKSGKIGDEAIQKRACHDCGAPTYNYRCEKCLAKWRRKNHVSETAVSQL